MRLLSQEEQRIEQYWDALEPEQQEKIGKESYGSLAEYTRSSAWFQRWRYLRLQTRLKLWPFVKEAMCENKQSS